MKPLCLVHDLLPAIAASMGQRLCEVCRKGGVDVAGAFIPDDPQSFGAPTGKGRVLFYAVHAVCAEAATPDMLAVIEDRLRRLVLPPERN